MSSKFSLLLGALALALLAHAEPAASPAPETATNPSYRLNSGDRLAVSVFGEPDLNVQQLIDQSGRIRLPLIGDVQVAGQTVREAETLIENSYREQEMLKSPQVTLALASYAPREVMVLGAVRSPGAFQFPPDVVSLDIRDVIARHGGFSPVAKGDAVALTRRHSDGQETTTNINVERMMFSRSKKYKSETILVYPGDRIFVPERLF